MKDFDAPVLFVCAAGKTGVADLIVRWCNRFGYPCLVMSPDWDNVGKSAAYACNAEMISIASHLLVFKDSTSQDAAHLVELAISSGRQITTIHITPSNF